MNKEIDTMNTLPVMKPYIGGQWIESESQKFNTIYDPSTGKPIAQVPQCTAAEVEKAIAAAKAAFPAWKNTPVRNRANIMMKLRGLIERDKDELTRMVATENGKCWSEAAGDVAKALEMTELACSAPTEDEYEHWQTVDRPPENLGGKGFRV